MKKPFTEIDLSSLELDFLAQPKLMDKATKRSAEAKKNLAELKAEQEVVEAEVKQRIRRNPEKYRVVIGARGAVTEAAINEALTLSRVYREISAKVVVAKHAVDVYDGLINTLEHRKRTIEGLITLHGLGYWSKPRVDKKANQSFAEDAEALRTKSVFTRKRKKSKNPI